VTSLLHALTELEAADRADAPATSPAAQAREPASSEAIRLALQLRTARSAAGRVTLLFVPTAAGLDAGLVVDDAVRGLRALDEGPVLVMDLWSREDSVQEAVSGEFHRRLAEARSLYAYTLCVGGTLPDSVETLATAGSFDGVVLVVPPGRTTRTSLLEAKAQLSRAHANLFGFVLDARRPSRSPARK
jgi:hypothetical protein